MDNKEELKRLQQLDLEKSCIDSGMDKFLRAVQDAQNAQRGSETTYATDMMRYYVKNISRFIQDDIQVMAGKAGRKSIAAFYLKGIDPDTAAFITAKCVFNRITPKIVSEAGLSNLATDIAKKVEDNARFEAFDIQSRMQAKAEGKKGGYFKATMEMLAKRKVTEYQRKKAALRVAAEKAEDYDNSLVKWNSWPEEHRIHIGVALLDCFIKGTSDYEGGVRIEGSALVEKLERRTATNNMYYVVVPTDKMIEWVKGNLSVMQHMQPDFYPCVSPPLEWLSSTDGGYYSKGLQDQKPLVKAQVKSYLKEYTPENSSLLFNAANTLQTTQYEINAFVLEQALQEIRSPNGVGMPGQKEPLPECPLQSPEGLSAKELKAWKLSRRGTLEPDEKKLFAEWKEACKQIELSNQAKMSKLLQVSKTISLAQKFQFTDDLYFVYTVDFRGRMYAACSDLSPQGTDLSKGLLRFKNAKPLGKNGLKHLYYHAAGLYDIGKVSLQERYDWVCNQLETIQAIGLDPEGTREFWSQADKPYMFLAAAEEIGEITHWVNAGNKVEDFMTKLICFQDGSCNGLQHLSAMLRDKIGGQSVNLIDSERPCDIYGVTSDLVIKYLNKTIIEGKVYNGKEWLDATDQDVTIAKALLDFGITRKTTKKSTMTVPYDGTKIGCRDQVSDWYYTELDKRLAHDGSYKSPLEFELEVVEKKGITKSVPMCLKQLHHYVWLALDETVVAARTAMKLLQQVCSAVQHEAGQCISWTTPAGYKVYQEIKDVEECRIKTKIDGCIQLKIKKDIKTINKRKMRTSIAPNFVHSLDASHLMLIIHSLQEMGINDISTVHDSFGVHAGDCDLLHYAIRKTFINMYSEDILLKFWKEQAEAHPEAVKYFPDITLVKKGDLNLKEVLRSTHFFR